MCLDDCNCVPITSSVGPKGDTGATGATGPAGATGPTGSINLQNYNREDSAGTDIYNTGNGLDVTIIASKTVGGTVSYWGECFVQVNDSGNVTIKPKVNGVADITKITIATLPPPSTKSYLTIPISGKVTVPLGQSFSINILGPSGLSAVLRTMNLHYTEA